jgi:NDP-sugar pyrophosphorylase family protein
MVVDYLKTKNNFNMRLEISREADQLLDTGGGLKKAAWFFQEDPALLDEPFLLHNVDVISTIDLAAMLQFHKQNQALATLAVQTRESSRQLLFNNQFQLSGRADSHSPLVYPEPRGATNHSFTPSPEGPLPQSKSLPPLHPAAFSGIHILSPRLLPQLTETAPFSIIDSYLRLASQGQKILAFRHDHSYWRDLGKPADLAQASLDLQQVELFDQSTRHS